MKYLLLVFTTVLTSIPGVRAQPEVTLSQTFPEPDFAWNQVLQLKNGNTVMLQFTKNAGIEASVYNKQRNLVSRNPVKSSQWSDKKFSLFTFDGFYEIGGQPVLFLSQIVDRIPTLFRVRLDAGTGAVLSDEAISSLPAKKTATAWDVATGNSPNGNFHVIKDPLSDYYAVIRLDYNAEVSGFIEISHYLAEGGRHRELFRGLYDGMNSFKGGGYYLGAVVNAGDVYLCSYGIPVKWNAAESRLIISKLPAGQKEFVHKELEYEADFRNSAAMLYNPGTGLIQLLALTKQKVKSKLLSGKSTTYYELLMNYFNTETLELVSSKPLDAQMVSNALYTQTNKESYPGMPVDMKLNKDYSTAVLYEELTTREVRDGNGRLRRVTTSLGPAGVSELTSRGVEVEGYGVVKLQNAMGYINPFFHVEKGASRWGAARTTFGNTSNAFYSFDYINTGKSRYILFNDYPKNFEKKSGQSKRQAVAYSSVTNMVCYKLAPGSAPEKSYLFGTPEHKRDEARFGFIQYSSFLPEENTYATVVILRDGRKKEAAVAWVRLD